MKKVENIELDESNVDFNNAFESVNKTDKFVYLTGKAGTGKTTFLKFLKQVTEKNTVILAPTGVAAINAGGQTIHSFFQIPFGPFVLDDKRLRTKKEVGELDETTIYSTFRYREDKRKIIEKLELLIIDEVSMVRCDTLDVIDRILRVYRKKPYLPFGGIQVLLIGDTFQLPPIADFEQWEILKSYYESPFFFSSRVVVENKPLHIELKKIYRQKEQDFIDILNKIRVNQISDVELDKLNEKFNPIFESKNSDGHIILSTTNLQVNQTNSTKLEQLPSELKIFEGVIEGVFPKDGRGQYILPTEQNLHLKVGAQVMILKNDTGEIKSYYNGKIGKIDSLNENRIIVEFPDSSKVQIEKSSWTNIQYSWNIEKRKIEEKIIGTFIQYPLRLAWAITVHKSQGLTFEKVYADLGSAFEDGQVYVALSRCSSYGGLVLKTKIPRSRIRTNSKVIEFAKTETPATLIVQELNSGKADFHYKKVREYISSLKFEKALESFIQALKFRNDIESDLFKKYFLTTIKKYSTYKSKFLKSNSDLKLSIDKIELLDNNLLSVEIENTELKSKIQSQNDAVGLLLKKIKEFERQIEINENLIVELKSALGEFEKSEKKHLQSIDRYKLNIKELHGALGEFEKSEKKHLQSIDRYRLNIKELQDIVLSKDREIERLEDLKWYEKLLGKQ